MLLWLTLLVRVVWLSIFPADPLEPVDAQGYHLLALNLLAGHGLSLDWEPPFCLTAIRTPLYPLFLAGSYRLLGADPSRAVLFNLLLEVLTAAWVVRLGRSVGGRRAGALAGLCYALNGTTQRFTGFLLTEPLLLPLIAAALWATVTWLRRFRPGPPALAGLLWGLAVLTKPNEQFLAPGMGGLLAVAAFKRSPAEGRGQAVVRGLSSVVVFGAALTLVLAPWWLRNRLLLGRWLLSTAFEENTARVTAVATLAAARGIAAEPWTETWEALYLELTQAAAHRYGWDARVNDWEAQLPCAEREARHQQIATVARAVVLARPGAALVAHGAGVGRSLLDVGHRLAYRAITGRDWSATGVVDDIWVRMGESLRIGAVGDALHAFWLERVVRIPPDAALIWWGLFAGRLAVWGLGLCGLWRLRSQPFTALALAAVVVYHIVLPGPIAYDRFYAPAIPATVTLVALGALKGKGWPGN